jgi:hypothetical protein
MLAGEDPLDRRTELWHVLMARHWDTAPSWEQLFDDLIRGPGMTAAVSVSPDSFPAEVNEDPAEVLGVLLYPVIELFDLGLVEETQHLLLELP